MSKCRQGICNFDDTTRHSRSNQLSCPRPRAQELIYLNSRLKEAEVLDLFVKSIRGIRHFDLSRRVEMLKAHLVPQILNPAADSIVLSFGKDDLRALVSYQQQVQDFMGNHAGMLTVVCDPDDQEATAWCIEQLKFHAGSFATTTLAVLYSTQTNLLPTYFDLGLTVHGLQFIGTPADGIAGLQKSDVPMWTELGLQSVPLESAQQIDDVVQLKLEYFREHPEYCFFYSNASASEHDRTRMLDLLRSKNSYRKVIYDNYGLAGSYAYDVIRNDYAVGMDICFRPRIHGIGAGKCAYKDMFEAMSSQGIGHYRGVTSNPAVLHLTQKFNRSVATIHLKTGTSYFPFDRFSPYLNIQ